MAGLSAGSHSATREEIGRSVGSLRLEECCPGVLGIGVSVPLAATGRDVHFAQLRVAARASGSGAFRQRDATASRR